MLPPPKITRGSDMETKSTAAEKLAQTMDAAVVAGVTPPKVSGLLETLREWRAGEIDSEELGRRLLKAPEPYEPGG